MILNVKLIMALLLRCSWMLPLCWLLQQIPAAPASQTAPADSRLAAVADLP